MISNTLDVIARLRTTACPPLLKRLLCLSIVVLFAGCGGDADRPADQRGQLPVIRGNIPNATADKPQSKIWYAHDRWWAWLPTPTGSRIWSRGDNGWGYDATLEKQLQGHAGRADVWADDTRVRAVLVASNRITIVTLRWNDSKRAYRLQGKPTIWPLKERSSVETATIARDSTGNWWVAYDRDRVMWVRRSLDAQATDWTEPIAVSESAAPNDFCAIVALPDDVAVFWSDHVADAFLFRRHSNDSAADEWEDVEVVVAGPGTVDDHINAVVAGDGTLYVATRTRGGGSGQPGLQLHVRQPQGEWSKFDYGLDNDTVERSRPVAFLSEESQKLHLCHSVYSETRDDSRTSRIACLSQLTESLTLSQQESETVAAELPVNNVTGPKAPLPAGVRPLILASDAKGNVYEGLP